MGSLFPATLPYRRPDKTAWQQTKDMPQWMTLQLLKKFRESSPNNEKAYPDKHQKKPACNGEQQDKSVKTCVFKRLLTYFEEHSGQNRCEDQISGYVRRME